ncbi:MAG: hypothetical protein SGJ10_02855 [Bacteroidota bacterium]|nr:hypothetical protein [Bacteroidota bacterium]
MELINYTSRVFYRLKQIEENGNVEYTPINDISIKLHKQISINLYPNPSNGIYNIEGDGLPNAQILYMNLRDE